MIFSSLFLARSWAWFLACRTISSRARRQRPLGSVFGRLGIEGGAEPFGHFGVPFMFRVGYSVEQLAVTVQTAVELKRLDRAKNKLEFAL